MLGSQPGQSQGVMYKGGKSHAPKPVVVPRTEDCPQQDQDIIWRLPSVQNEFGQ